MALILIAKNRVSGHPPFIVIGDRLAIVLLVTFRQDRMALTGIKFRAYPTSRQKRALSQWMGCARFIYNAKCDDEQYYRTFLAHSLSLTGEKVPIDQSYAQYKGEQTPWLNDCPSQILRNSATIWYQAYQRYRQGLAGRPKRKNKEGKNSIWLTSELFRFEQGKLFIGTKTNNIGYCAEIIFPDTH